MTAPEDNGSGPQQRTAGATDRAAFAPSLFGILSGWLPPCWITGFVHTRRTLCAANHRKVSDHDAILH